MLTGLAQQGENTARGNHEKTMENGIKEFIEKIHGFICKDVDRNNIFDGNYRANSVISI